MTLWNGLHKLDIIFGITQKLLCIKPSKLLRWKITKKGIFLKVLQAKERLVASSRPLLFFIILSIKRAWEQREKLSWLFKDFLIVFFQKNFFSREFLAWSGCFGIFTKIKKGSGTSFPCAFSAYFFHKNVSYLILYQLTKFQYQIYFPSQDIFEFLS